MSDSHYIPIQPQRGKRLSQLVSEQLTDSIVTGKLKPGEWLPAERNLEKMFLVSRAPIREALNELVTKELLVKIPGEGLRVADTFTTVFTPPLVAILTSHPQARMDILELRRLLEGAAAYYAAIRSTPQEHQKLRQSYQRLAHAYVHGSLEEAARADAEYHMEIVHAAHNHALYAMMNSFFSLLQGSVLNTADTIRRNKANWDKTDEHHRALLDAILNGEAEKAREIAFDHLTFLHTTLGRDNPWEIA
ncbi:FCD domain-containing protein [Enterobacter cloacae subsp. cloacae]|uniref:FadR/GntR family transcriptional regulator n=1 Tax=Enterobacter cloacae TaxID=550 RepID=UPI001C5AE278|nr:FCD domain-containing protein [Enterobacter cloacae]MBW4201922.1 FCD domain-containing protein [Enterobacter cloacae subsp. cloacae]